MACNSCSQPFSFLRPEKGCPSCGFSYCSKCLNVKIFVQKLNAEKKVCGKCSRKDKTVTVHNCQPPDAFYRHVSKTNENNSDLTTDITSNKIEQEIHDRLQKLKDSHKVNEKISNEDLAVRLQNLKGPMPSTSDAELYSKLAKIKGVSIDAVGSNKILLSAADLRTEQEQADDLLKQYVAQTRIESDYKNEFGNTIANIEERLQKLKSSNITNIVQKDEVNVDSEDEETSIKKIIEKVKAEVNLDIDFPPDTNDELPFCEICNEDASVRCKGCKYLFCMGCFNEHKDDDDDCNEYVTYKPPK